MSDINSNELCKHPKTLHVSSENKYTRRSRLSAWDMWKLLAHTQTRTQRGVRSGRERDTDWGPAEPSQANDSQHTAPKEKYIVERRPAIYTVLCYTHSRGPQVTHETTTGVGCFSRFVFVTSRAMQLLLLCASAVDPSEELPSAFYPPN